MALIFHFHPLASFCHKVLLALYENGTPFEGRVVDLADPVSSAELFALWPVGKIPVLRDDARGRTVAETSIIIEYLDRQYPGAVRLIPADPDQALQVRLWDRFYDLYVNTPMGKMVTDRLRPAGYADPHGVEEARATLRTAYGMIERQMAEAGPWAAGAGFSMADCAAAPALFYAGVVEPFGPDHSRVAAYFERLLERPAFRRTLREAKPYFGNFPMRADMPARFLEL